MGEESQVKVLYCCFFYCFYYGRGEMIGREGSEGVGGGDTLKLLNGEIL